MLRRHATILLIVFLGLVACRQGSGREMDKLIDIGTHHLHIRCMGQGDPVVVIDTGVGDTSERWSDIQAQVAPITRVCTYDRAGYGSSEPGPLPRHSQRAADELKRLLAAAGIRGPYLLVGHSLGGLNGMDGQDHGLRPARAGHRGRAADVPG